MSILLRSINRRTFLKISAYLSSFISTMNINKASAKPYLQSESEANGYGMGLYGEGEYPAQTRLYIPFVVKEGN